MKKYITILLVLLLCFSLSGCAFLKQIMTGEVASKENTKAFYNKVIESKEILDNVATDVCAAWKDATYDYKLSTKDVNDAIEKAKNEHSENIAKVNEFDKEIRNLFEKAKPEMKDFSSETVLKQVMTAYSEYMDDIINANEALNPSGYIGVSSSKSSLDRALQNLFVEL